MISVEDPNGTDIDSTLVEHVRKSAVTAVLGGILAGERLGEQTPAREYLKPTSPLVEVVQPCIS